MQLRTTKTKNNAIDDLPGPAAHFESVQVAFGPAHRQLDDRLELAQAGVARHR